MNLQILLNFIIITVFTNVVESSVIINKADDDKCELDPNLIQEIASYKRTVRWIINEIIENGYGEDMYKE